MFGLSGKPATFVHEVIILRCHEQEIEDNAQKYEVVEVVMGDNLHKPKCRGQEGGEG